MDKNTLNAALIFIESLSNEDLAYLFEFIVDEMNSRKSTASIKKLSR